MYLYRERILFDITKRLAFGVQELDQVHPQLFESNYPCLVKGQSKEFRLACFKFIELLRKSPSANPSVQNLMLRKSDLDDFRGERFERVVLILTTALLEQAVTSRACFSSSADYALDKENQSEKATPSKDGEVKRLQVQLLSGHRVVADSLTLLDNGGRTSQIP